jgi:putative ABC transport system permease protein
MRYGLNDAKGDSFIMKEKNKKGGLLFIIKIAYRNIYRNLRRSLLCFIAIALAVFFIIFSISFMDGMFGSSYNIIKTFEIGDISIYTKEYESKKDFYPLQYPIEPAGNDLGGMINEIKSIKGVKEVFPRIKSYATLSDSNVKHAIIWGIDIDNEMKANYFNLRDRSNGLKLGRYPNPDENGCAIGMVLAKRLGLTIGNRIQLKIISSQYSDKFYTPVITGIFDYDFGMVNKNFIVVSFDRLQKLAVLKGKTQTLSVYLDNPAKAKQIKTQIADKLNDDTLKIMSWEEHYFTILVKQSDIIMRIVLLIFVIVASFLIINTILMVIHERIKEIGMMGSLGMTRFEIVEVFFFESIFLSLIGSVIGVIIGGMATLLGSFYPIDINVFTGGGMENAPFSNTLFIKFSFKIIIEGFLFGVLTSSICTIFPSLKAAFVEPVEALRR